MSRPKGSGSGGLVNIGMNVEPDLARALRAWAEANELTVSEACRQLLRACLVEDPSTSKAVARHNAHDDGYNDGVRRGLHDLRVAIQAATVKLWRR